MNSPATSAPKESLHDWLMSERPQSRRQASLGRAYGAWRTFARNRLAMLGLAIVVPWLAHASWHAYRDLVDSSGLVARP